MECKDIIPTNSGYIYEYIVTSFEWKSSIQNYFCDFWLKRLIVIHIEFSYIFLPEVLCTLGLKSSCIQNKVLWKPIFCIVGTWGQEIWTIAILKFLLMMWIHMVLYANLLENGNNKEGKIICNLDVTSKTFQNTLSFLLLAKLLIAIFLEWYQFILFAYNKIMHT